MSVQVAPSNTEPEEASALGDTLARLRRSRRLSVAALAERAGMSRQHVWRIEKGKVPSPGKEILQRLAGALQVSVSSLVPVANGRERVLNVLVANAGRIGEADWENLKDLAARLLAPQPVGSSRPKQWRLGQGSPRSEPCQAPVSFELPDDLKVIAQFFARREGRPDQWSRYAKEAFELRAELKSRSAYFSIPKSGRDTRATGG